MKKKRLFSLATILLSLSISGCFSTGTKTDDDDDKVTEGTYMGVEKGKFFRSPSSTAVPLPQKQSKTRLLRLEDARFPDHVWNLVHAKLYTIFLSEVLKGQLKLLK